MRPITDAQRLTLVRALHTVIYGVMAGASLVVLYAGITGAHGPWLWAAAALVAVESVVFAAFGLKCPLTAIAVKYGATRDGAYDTFMPEQITRWTFAVFGPVIVLGFGLLAVRWGLGWRSSEYAANC